MKTGDRNSLNFWLTGMVSCYVITIGAFVHYRKHTKA